MNILMKVAVAATGLAQAIKTTNIREEELLEFDEPVVEPMVNYTNMTLE